MKLVHRLVLVLACAACGSVHALSTCNSSVTSLVFGSYNSLSAAATDSVANVSVTCSGSIGEAVNLSIQLNAGSSANLGLRSMLQGSNALRYNLFSNAARSVIWGDGSANSTPVFDAFTMPSLTTTRNYPVYGRIFARQAVPLGTYTDTITVTVSY